MTLDDLQINQIGIIKKVNITSKAKRRLLDLGLIENTKIKPMLENISGSMRAYEFRNTLIAIRKEDAKHIDLKKYNNLI